MLTDFEASCIEWSPFPWTDAEGNYRMTYRVQWAQTGGYWYLRLQGQGLLNDGVGVRYEKAVEIGMEALRQAGEMLDKAQEG